MPTPQKLTLCEPPDLDWSRTDAPASSTFSDIYFSVDGGLDETREVFLKACGLPENWKSKDYFAIGELGFGTGLNFLAAWKLWEDTPEPKARLHFVSIERFPLDQKQLAKALSKFPEISDFADKLVNQWPGRVKGIHTLEFGRVTLTLIHDDILNGLAQIDGTMDAWFLDGFSPARNPEMWSGEVMDALARLSRLGTRIGTFTVARSVRDGLTNAGFETRKMPGFGRKRDRLEAIYNRGHIRKTQPIQDPVIIGAGIAGLMMARSFQRRGITTTIIDPNDGTAASGNPAAIIKPRLDLQDRPESRFFLSSFIHATQVYSAFDRITQGVSHQPQGLNETKRYQKLLNNPPLPERMFCADSKFHNISFPTSLTINPNSIKSKLLPLTKMVTGEAASSLSIDDGLAILDKKGNTLASGNAVIWTCGFGVRSLELFENQNLRYSRGQISMISQKVSSPLTYGGYAVPVDETTLIGATHKRLDSLPPHGARIVDDAENLEKFETIFGYRPNIITGQSRSSVRVTTPSTLPRIVNSGNEWGLTGLGSRGFVFAPLLAEAIVARICGEVSPISQKLWARFQAREKDPT